MSDQISEQTISDLLARVRQGIPTAEDLAGALRSPLVAGLSRWELWALVGFVRHERRQRWVGYVVETNLGRNKRDLGMMGAVSHPDGAQQMGTVPDMLEWRYFFHGIGCCLTHDDGTAIDVDFSDEGSADEIDPYFYAHFLSSTKKLEWSDAQLRNEPPLELAWHFDLAGLLAQGYIEREWRFRVTDAGRLLIERIEPVVDEINRLAQLSSAEAWLKMSRLLVALGDAVSAASILALVSPELASIVAHVASAQREVRAALLRAATAKIDDRDCRPALMALATLSHAHAASEVSRIIGLKPPTAEHLLCLQMLGSWNDRGCEPMLVAAIYRSAPPRGIQAFFRGLTAPANDNVERVRSSFIVEATRLVLSWHTPSTLPPKTSKLLRRVLSVDRRAREAEAGFLLYLFSRRAGLAKIQASLSSQVSRCRSEAAIYLGMIGTDEALHTLLHCAAGDPEKGGHEAASVLSLLPDERARAAFDSWRQRNDGYEDIEAIETEWNGRKRKTWRMGDLIRAQTREFIEGDAKRLHRNYGPLLATWTCG